jgi:D-3-phosphoglycerate dehydrogenase
MKGELDIYVTLSTFGEQSRQPLGLLEQSGLSFALHNSGKRITKEELLRDAARSRCLLAGVEIYDEDTLRSLPKLRCISRCGVGVDNIDLDAARRLNIAVLNTPDEPVEAVAELALAMMLALVRRLPALDRAMHNRAWHRITGNLLSGKTVGIIGLGRIGRRLAELLRVFGVRLVAFDPMLGGNALRVPGIEFLELEDLLRVSDIVSLHASGSAPLHLGKKELASMKKGSFLINLARGSMVDDVALAAALGGHLAGAALDTFPEEPYAGPLCDCENAILSPHQATLTHETRVAMEVKAVRNALDFLHADLPQ